MERLLMEQAGLTDLPSRIAAALPGAQPTSGLRSPEEQRALIARGATTATNSPHLSGNAFDMRPIDGMTPQQALAQLQQNGVPVSQVIDESRHGGTGPHWHFAGDLGGGMPAIGAPGGGAVSRGDVTSPSPVSSGPDEMEALLAAQAATAGPSASPQSAQPEQAPAGPPGTWGQYIGHGANDAAIGVVRGIGDAAGTIAAGLDLGAGKLGLATDFQGNVDRHQKELEAMQYNPDGWAAALGRFGADAGIGVGTALIPGLGISAETALLARALKYAGQGAAAGMLSSGGHNVAANTVTGALGGAAGGFVGEKAVAAGLKAYEKAAGTKLAGKLREMLPGKATAEAGGDVAGPVAKTIARGSEIPPDGIGPNGILRVNITPADAPPAGVEPALPPRGGVEGEPGRGPVLPDAGSGPDMPPATDSANPLPTEADLLKAMGSRAARSGIGRVTNLPPDVKATFDDLVSKGVPADQALREADIRGVGAEPTYAMVTRDRASQAALREGAKMDSDDGRALADALASSNAALHGTVQRMVEGFGGIPSQGRAMEGAARALAAASDAERKNVARLYAEAAASGGDIRVQPDALWDVVSDPRRRGAVTDQGRAFIRGMRSRLNDLTVGGRRGLSATDLDQLHQAATQAYNYSGPSEVNMMIREAKDALEQHLDQIGEAGPLYAQARAAHRAWAEQYENPDGVRKLIARDPEGRFHLADAWRSADDMIGRKDDSDLIEISRQLKAIGRTDELNRLKALAVQRAYEKATGSVTDEIGNSNFNGKLFHNYLSNNIGGPKMGALFDKEEIARLASIGRAGTAINEAPDGVVNRSNTSSALVRAMAAMNAKGEKSPIGELVAHGVASSVLPPGVGSVAASGVRRMADAMSKAAQGKAMSEAVRQELDPAAARAGLAKLERAIRRHQQGGAVAARVSAPASSAAVAAELRKIQGKN